MTIARTGNKVVDDLARASAANQRKEAAIKAKAARASKASARMCKVNAGRSAIRSGAVRGRGIVAKMHKSGKAASGLLSYCLDKVEATLISSNCGTNKTEIANDIMRCAALRNIKEPVGHISLSLPHGQTPSHETWRAMVDVVRDQIGLDDSFSFAAILHDDAHQNLHIPFSRVSDTGKVFNDYRLGLRLAAVEDVIEDKFGLKLIQVNRINPLPNLGKPEVERAIRLGIQPDRMQLHQIAMWATQGRPSVLEFIAKVAEKGVVVRPNISQTGKLNGFSFSMLESPHVEFKGSQIGLSWSKLQKIGVRYDKNSEFEALAKHVEKLGKGERTDDRDQQSSARPTRVGKEIRGTNEQAARTNRESKATSTDSRWTDYPNGGLEHGGDIYEAVGIPVEEFNHLKARAESERLSSEIREIISKAKMSDLQRQMMNAFIKTLEYNFDRLQIAEAGTALHPIQDAGLDVPRF